MAAKYLAKYRPAFLEAAKGERETEGGEGSAMATAAAVLAT